jgi:hypothetical protein
MLLLLVIHPYLTHPQLVIRLMHDSKKSYIFLLFAAVIGRIPSKIKYSRAPVSTDPVSAVSVNRCLPRPEKKLEN